jgi:hypothetical protein
MNISQFKDKHAGEKILVLGCGTSLKKITEIDNYKGLITIGVNDIGRMLDPTYLLVVDSPKKFMGIRHDVIFNSKSEYVFTQLNAWDIKQKEKLVMFKLGNKSLSNIKNEMVIDYSNSSPYMAAILAHKMGSNRIGMLGVDFTPNHFYAEDGDHDLIRRKRFAQVEEGFKALHAKLASLGTELFNLSEFSAVTTVPKIKISEF